MTLGFAFLLTSFLVAGSAATTILWSRFAAVRPGRWESAASTAVTAFIIAIATSWLLCWLRLLNKPALLASASILLVGGGIVLWRHRAFARRPAFGGIQAVTLLAAIPLLLWIAFVLWRGAVVPVLSHDALAYHMPKAVMIARAQQYAFFDAPDPRIGTSPANYELLVADVLLTTGSDDVTEWVGTAAYLALLLLAAALVERWWGNGPHVAITLLITAAVPVTLLHAGAHKNDLLSNVFYAAALLWGARWLVSQELAPFLLGLASLACGVGTKLQGIFVVAALMAVAAWLFARRRLAVRRRHILVLAIAVPLGILLLGGWAYVTNLVHTGHAAVPASSSSDAGYGDWTNLIEVPLLLLMRPFDRGIADIYVPWRHQRWYWPRYELFFSDFGIVMTLLALAIPFAIARYARDGSQEVRSERTIGSAAATLSFAAMLPIRIRPLGFFAGFPRYFVFITLFVVAWTAAPVIRELASRGKRLQVVLLSTGFALAFVAVAISYTINDAFQPLFYVAYVARHPETRQPFFAGYRAATTVDQIAGPNDTIAIDAGFDSWIYPLYGRSLQRKVIFVNGSTPIPREARFVAVDRAWNIIWGAEGFRDMGQYRRYLAQGTPSDEDLAVVKRLFADNKTYVPLYRMRARNQAVFMRRDAGPLRPRAVVPVAGSSR